MEDLRKKICELTIGCSYEDLSSADQSDVDDAMKLIDQECTRQRIEEVRGLYFEIANHEGRYAKGLALSHLDDREKALKAKLNNPEES